MLQVDDCQERGRRVTRELEAHATFSLLSMIEVFDMAVLYCKTGMTGSYCEANQNFRRVIKDEHAKVRDYWCASRASLEYELGLKLSCPDSEHPTQHRNGKVEEIPCSGAVGGSAHIRMTSTLMSSELECAHILGM